MENNTITEQQRFERAHKRVKAISGFYKHLIAYILVNLFLISRAYFNLKPGEEFFQFSNFSVAFFWGIGLAFNFAGVFGKNAFWGQNWEEKKINEIIEKEKTAKWE